MFSLLIFSSIFPGGGSADPICSYVRTPTAVASRCGVLAAVGPAGRRYQQRPMDGPLEWRSADTDRCSYRVRGVESSCAKHSTVPESYTVVMSPTLIIISIQSPSQSFNPGLKPSFFSCKSFPPQPSFSSPELASTDSPDCLPILLSTSVFFTFKTFCLSTFLVAGAVRRFS